MGFKGCGTALFCDKERIPGGGWGHCIVQPVYVGQRDSSTDRSYPENRITVKTGFDREVCTLEMYPGGT